MVVGAFGCSSSPLTDTGPLRTIDASTRPIDAARLADAYSHPIDASPRASDAGLDTRLGCHCQLGGDGVMHMSWSCFETYIGTRNVLQFCDAPGALSSACGLVDYTFYDGNGLLQEYVYDESSGEQVGGHYATNNPYYAYDCPDQTIRALKVESGIFPASSCTTRTACGCTADGRSLACPRRTPARRRGTPAPATVGSTATACSGCPGTVSGRDSEAAVGRAAGAAPPVSGPGDAASTSLPGTGSD